MQKADISYFFSDIEVDEIQKIDPSIQACVVPLYVFDAFKEVSYSALERKDIMFVGGFGHSPNVDAIRWFVTEVWDTITAKIEGIRFYIIGSNPPDEIQEIACENIIVTGFVSDEKLDEYFGRCRLMVAPLRYGAGVKGKIVQAMYEGMPIVTTSIGAEGFEEAEKYMMIADDADEFTNKIIEAYGDEVSLKEYSELGSAYCHKFFSVEYAKQQMKNIFISEEKK
jgi:glycosyltransferase involved in cell wall biosynthesis